METGGLCGILRPIGSANQNTVVEAEVSAFQRP
jgi:hypothetical protein